MKVELIGQAMDIETQMAGLSLIGNMTEVIKAAARMLMSVTDTDVVQSSFYVRSMMLALPCGCCMQVSVSFKTVEWISDVCCRID